MRKILWPAAGIVGVLACGGEDGPSPAPFGLDQRPANATCVARARPVINTGVALQRQWSGLTFDQPMYVTQAPGPSGDWLVVQRGGTIRAFPPGATTNAQVRDFATVGVNTGGEGGLLGFALHPDWPQRLEAYLSYTRDVAGGDPTPPNCGGGSGHPFTSVVARFRSTNGGTSLNSGPDEILKVAQPYDNHNGGTIQFGPDKMLYFGLGDGGSGNDPCNAGQGLQTLLGKMLRLDVAAAAGMYRVPADNPFVGVANARPEIWALGFRNPFRWSFDRVSGEQWVGDVGQDTWEEIDRVAKGGNYGWRTCEGFHRRGSTTALCNTPGLIDPVAVHPRAEARSITGGVVYHGAAMPSLAGTYIYGDFATGQIWALLYDAENKAAPRPIVQVAPNTLVAFGQGNDGEVYTVQINGVISKLVPSAPVPPVSFPQLLSETGCTDPADARKPASGLIPYEVNSPLWSDGADKERWLALPDGATIEISADQDWELPIGSVTVKTFSLGEQRLETRLFMRHEDGGWGGYTYEWNEAGTDAVLLPAAKLRPLEGDAAWTYPSRPQCIQCHSRAAGSTLGLETAQLNRDAVYKSTNRISSQLATLEHIGVIAAGALPVEPPRLVSPIAGSDASIEARARAYLHANCSHCHRPMGGGQGMMDLRYDRSLRDTVTCNVDNTQGSVAGAVKLIAPGVPEASVLLQRMRATDSKRMPPVAVAIPDPTGTAVVEEWIRSLPGCP